MKNFDQMKQQWSKRPVPPRPEQGHQLVVEQFKKLRRNQIVAQVVLGVTVMVLVFFFFYISAYNYTPVYLGLGIMVGCMLIRIGLELSSTLRKNKLPVQEDMLTYNAMLVTYYNKRKLIHLLFTPVLFTGYIFGFILLLPSFKASLSTGFYTYIVVSSIAVFTGLAWLIIGQIRRELRILRSFG